MNRFLFGAGRRCFISFLMFGALSAAQNQSPPVDKRRFDVVSVRPAEADNKSNAMAPRLWGDDGTGRVSLHHVPLMYVLMRAFDVRQDQIAGHPWLETEFFDIIGIAPKRSSSEQISAMLRNMMLDRFKLTWHSDSKTSQVYSLTVSPSGPRMKEVSDGTIQEPDESPAVNATGSGDDRRLSSNSIKSPAGPLRLSTAREGGVLVSTFVYSRMSMADLSRFLSQFFELPVLDSTGLTGHYEVTIRKAGGLQPDLSGNAIPLPDLVTESVNRLGLWLVKKRISVDKIVIDHIERKPTEN